MISTIDPPARRFRFDRDTFTFANELVWQYLFDPRTQAMTTFRRETPPTYSHRCFVMVRATRQFFWHARFDPAQPPAEPETYRRLIGAVVSRSPRQPSLEPERIIFPGYDCLRAFSGAWEPLLKAGLGSAWQSYFVRSHWRMVFPTSRRHQQRMATQLRAALAEGRVPVVHLYRFPQLTINHGITLFDVTESEPGMEFDVYDPNIPDHPIRLRYERATRTFFFPPTHYWGGGKLNVYEIYTGWLY